MNNDGATVLSRKNRFDEPKKEKKPTGSKNHGGLLVFLVFLSLFLLASAPVYGMVKNQPKLAKSTTSSTKKTDKQNAKSQSATSQDNDQADSQSAVSSAKSSSSSAAESSSAADASSQSQEAAASANANTAVLGTGQTLYNFAITHNTSPANIVALNPGVTTTNYSQYAGQSLRIK
ncbi:LysM repeat (LysM) [Fructobacillus fructosus]|uniref:LysM peptidoglycan-binding domain-containing protein n=1 Tax=Fructobacillus fructosus TaxID=1631 RepID=UPI002DA1AF73|nr:LysM repeat (LysM) [Fructobacillus fructosus]